MLPLPSFLLPISSRPNSVSPRYISPFRLIVFPSSYDYPTCSPHTQSSPVYIYPICLFYIPDPPTPLYLSFLWPTSCYNFACRRPYHLLLYIYVQTRLRLPAFLSPTTIARVSYLPILVLASSGIIYPNLNTIPMIPNIPAQFMPLASSDLNGGFAYIDILI